MNGLREAQARMRAEGLPEPAIRAFARRFRRLAACEGGPLPDAELQPVGEMVGASRLPPPARPRVTADRDRQAQRRPRHQHGPARRSAPPGWGGGHYAFMRRVLASERGRERYAKRQGMIEPDFAHTKFNRRMDRFHRGGRSAARSEWRLRRQPVSGRA